jgi:hypothetical protein
MPFLNKEELAQKALELGVDLKGLTWQQKQKAVGKAITEANRAQETVREVPVVEQKKKLIPTTPVHEPTIEDIKGVTVFISPEMPLVANQLYKYEEELGYDTKVSPVSFDAEQAASMEPHKIKSATFQVKGKSGRKVIATSTLPRWNAEMTYRPDRDIVPVVTCNGKSGYLWTHHKFPNIKQLLMDSGYYYDYKRYFNAQHYPNNIWYAAGKLLVANIETVHSIFREIEHKAQQESK